MAGRIRGLSTSALIGAVVLMLLAGCAREVYLEPTENVVEVRQAGDKQLTCGELDQRIGDLYGQAMDFAPEGFHEDQGNTAAGSIGTFAFSPAYLYVLRNEVVDKPRQRERFDAVTGRIEWLQQLKARKHCFEY
ncbi:MAG: hypothetical protein ACQERG_01555 [Pseudomonadota bacterium]